MMMHPSSRLIGILSLALIIASICVAVGSAAGPDSTATEWIVTSTADSGPGTLRQAILDAGNGDTITFDPVVFPPGSPATIYLNSALPSLTQGGVTIDGSNAGAILDGSAIPPGYYRAFSVESDGNVIRGLQMLGFPDEGILIMNANDNVIGGDRSIGSAPLGQGNLISANGGPGIEVCGESANNEILGNYIGTDLTGSTAMPNTDAGVVLQCSPGPHDNTIGGATAGTRNVISGNDQNGVSLSGDAHHNTVIGNYVGTDASGTTSIGNGARGVSLDGNASYNLIGGTSATPGGACTGECNLISGNTYQGIVFDSSGATYNTAQGNYVGTDVNGTYVLPNRGGVWIGSGASYNVIGGDRFAGQGNLISGNTNGEVNIQMAGTMHNVVKGNDIGVDASGTGRLGTSYGVTIKVGAQYNLIGGTALSDRNLISGEGNGIEILDTNTMSNTVSGNYIGTDVSGSQPVGNLYHGIYLGNGASRNLIGGPSETERNFITYNSNSGVSVQGTGTDDNVIQSNWIGIDADGTDGIDPRDLVVGDDGTVFLAAAGRGIFRSTDSAASWQESNTGLTTLDIEHLAVSPAFSSDGRVWAWGDGVLFVSDNAGASWSLLSSDLSGDVRALAVSPNYTVDQILLTGSWADALYRSADGGVTWAPIDEPGQMIYVDSLAFSPNFAVDQVVLASSSWYGVLRSADGGLSWVESNDGLLSNGVADLTFAPDGQTVFLASNTCSFDRVYRSSDAGQSWAPSGTGVDSCGPEWAVAISPDFGTDGIAIVSEDSIYRSADGGSNWNRSSDGAFGSRGRALAFSPSFISDQTVYAVTWAGVFRSTDGGNSWSWGGANLADRGNGQSGVEVCCGAGATQILDNVIGANGGEGIRIADPEAEGTLIDGNLVGLAPDGFTRAANGGTNIRIDTPYITASNNTSSAGSHGGLRSGIDAHHLTITGNRFGTDQSGMVAVGNSYDGITLESHTDMVRDNLISGNWGDGIYANETVENTVFAGNLIGLDASGIRALADGNPGSRAPAALLDGEALLSLEANGELGNLSSGIYLQGSNNTIGGSTPADRNVISGNASYGIYLQAGQYNVITGNYFGTDATGMAAVPNRYYGVVLSGADHNTIGGTTEGERNLSSGNGYNGLGMYNSSYNTVSGNYVGADASGAPELGNGSDSILLWGDSQGNFIGGINAAPGGGCAGGCNIIVSGDGAGITIRGGATLYNTVSQNSIYANGNLGIDLIGGGNTELPAPVITAFDLGAGTASGTACGDCTVELFSDEAGEGRWFEGSTTADASGDWTFAKGSAFLGPELTATATDAAGNTSEFGQDWPADPPPTPFIAAPVCGVTNQSRPAFSGLAQMGSTVSLGAEGAFLGNSLTDDENHWELSSWPTLADASYAITATATTAWGTSPEAELALTIDSALCYDPVGVTFTQGSVTQHPRDASGCADPGQDLGIDLWPDEQVTVSVPVEDAGASVYVEVNSAQYPLSDPDSDGVFTATFPAPSSGLYVIVLAVDCGGGVQTMQIGATIDPDGYVYDARLLATTGVTETVEGAEVTLLVLDTARDRWVEWDADLYGQINPQVTGDDGYFAFFTPPGDYQLVVDATHLGFVLYESPVLTVVDEPIRFDVPLWSEKRIYLPLMMHNH